VALFSFFAKKNKQPENPERETVNPAEEVQQDSTLLPNDDAAEREALSLRMQRDIARMTAEKIDAIESEIARDILKTPISTTAPPAETQPEEKTPPAADENLSAGVFHATLVRIDKETRILFKEDMDE
jgi:hypothetical protein